MAVEPGEQANKAALSSLWLGLLGFVSFGATALVGIFFGVMAIMRINAGNGRPADKTLALWGIAASTLALLVMLPLALLLIFSQGPARVDGAPKMTIEEKDKLLCENLRQIRDAVARFYSDTGFCPADLDDLVAKDAGEVTAPIAPTSYHGPYLPTVGGINGSGIPINPFANGDRRIAKHWRYKLGRLTSAVRGALKDGRRFQYL